MHESRRLAQRPQPALSRRHVLAALTAGFMAVFTHGLPALAAGARTGPWCREMSKVAREEIYDFTLHKLDSEDDDLFSLSALKGKPVWLQFFASWCGPCNREAADIVRIAAKYSDAIHVAGIDVGETPEHARAFRDAHNIPFTIALDHTQNVFHGLGFTAFPTHVFVDAQGYFSCISVGDLTPEQMDNEVAVALGRAPRPEPSDVVPPTRS